jgi:hypothetical protein
VRRHETLQGLLTLVQQLKDADPLWSSYRPAAANYVFVIPAPEGQRCAAVWRDGALRSVFPLAAAPRLDTPLYGFFRQASATEHPAELRDQLEAAGVRVAAHRPAMRAMAVFFERRSRREHDTGPERFRSEARANASVSSCRPRSSARLA